MSHTSTLVFRIGWLLLAICFLSSPFLPRVLAADQNQGVQGSVQIFFAGIEPSVEVLRAEKPQARAPRAEPESCAAKGQGRGQGLDQERRAVFDFSSPDASGLFAGSRWILLPDRFGFLPSTDFLKSVVSTGPSGEAASIPRVRSRTFTLIGHLSPTEPGGQILELHAAQEGPTGSHFTLDGFIRTQSVGRVLDAVYSFGLRGFEQIGRVRLRLEPRTPDQAPVEISDPDLAASLPALAQTGASQSTPEELDRITAALASHHARQERTLWEGGGDTFFRSRVEGHRFRDEGFNLDPVLFTVDKPEVIEGIPVMSQFAVNLTGTVDGVEFGPLPAMLMLSESEQPGQAVSVFLSAEGFPDGPLGTIGGSTTMGSDWEVQAKSGTLDFALRVPPNGIGGLQWIAMLNGAPSGAIPTRADGTLSVHGNRVEGSIEVEGHLALDGRQSSRYSARISGSLKKDETFERVLRSIGVLPLTGDWQTGNPVLGVIQLEQAGDLRTGTFGRNGSGKIDGRISDGMLILTWSREDGTSGWGFLRPLPGVDQAIGLWGSAADRSDAMPVLASQPQEPWNNLDDTTLSGEQVELLRSLGRDLGGQGKCTQALSVLDLVWGSYEKRLKSLEGSPERPETEIYGLLVNMYTISLPMIDCAYQLGRFDRTLDYLHKAVWLQSEMNPLSRAQNAFRYAVTSAATDLRDQADNFSTLITNLETLHTPKVGLGLDPRPAGQPLIIWAIAPGGPAALAGLKPGDEILSIDGSPATPLDYAEAMRALAGAEGTELKLVVSRAGEQRALMLVRGPWHYGLPSVERRAQIEAAMESLQISAEETRTDLLALAETIEKAEPPTAPSGPEFDKALKRVVDRIQAARDRIPKRVQRLIALGESLFGDWDRYMPTQRFVIYSFEQMLGANGLVPAAERPQSIDTERPIGVVEDEMIGTLVADPTLNRVEASLFHEQFKAALLTLGLWGQLTATSQGVEHRTRNARPTPETMAEHAQRGAEFSGWMERWRERMVLDSGKIEALDAGTCFTRDWLELLWELEPKTKDPDRGGAVEVSSGGAIEVLLAAESARNRAMQDLLASRKAPTFARQGGTGTTLTSLETQAPLTVDELVELVWARGGTSIVYQVLDDGLLVWVLDAAKLSCTSEKKPLMEQRAPVSGLDEEELESLGIDVGAEDLQDQMKTKIYRCQGIEARRLAVSAADIKAFANGFQSFAGRDISLGDGSAQAFSSLLHDLYQRLVDPIAPLLPDNHDTVVTIIPDAELFQIPFGALVQTPVNNDLAELHYLIEDHPIVYLTSIGMMRFTRDNARQAADAATSGFVTLFDPVGIEYSGLIPFFVDEESRRGAQEFLTTHFPQEAPRSLFSGAEATRANLFDTASRARVLTFVTHAEASEEPGDNQGSYIALAGAPLPLADIYELDLHSDLAILAGCVTGRGRIGADGVIGLSRAFVYAGAPTLAMTLWEVPAGDTLSLLDRFYRAYLTQDMSKAQALRQAQVEAISDLHLVPQPNLWAGMVLFGEP